MNPFSKVLSIGEGRQLRKYQSIVDSINTLEPTFQSMTDDELHSFTEALKARYNNGESLDDLLPQAFAAVREASVRTTGLRHFDVQLIGGMVLHDGKIAEMKTGEGKTLISPLAGYLNSISGEPVHIVTVNDYLAKRDSEITGVIYNFLGVSVGLIQNGMPIEERIAAYEADVTYGTNSEFGFDYLKDNMITDIKDAVQKGHYFAVIDEADSILIDEARTPLIISGGDIQSEDIYRVFANAVSGLIKDEDFEIDESKKTIHTTEIGLEKVESAVGIDNIYDENKPELVNHLLQALKAQFLFHKDIDYIVADGEVKIVDEFTGRVMEGRRFSDGLHQAIEAKEDVKIQKENQTIATITLQNYFRLYSKLSGMTGTAMTEESEFRSIYNMEVFPIPPNKPVIRQDLDDIVYRTIDAKFNAVVDAVIERHSAGQPCLVGTASVESSEKLSKLLDKRNIPHNTLNAKNHEREAHIIAQAGQFGAVTIATNMAGRGTDILLGGNPEMLSIEIMKDKGYDPFISEFDEDGNRNKTYADDNIRKESLDEAKKLCSENQKKVLDVGGLYVIGTERHESRRIDNQLRGRSGRQGDPGTTIFFLSLEDNLIRLFGGDKLDSISAKMKKSGLGENSPIESSIIGKAVENAQTQLESIHFSARKNVLEYDDVINLQRKAIYKERNLILNGKKIVDSLPDIIENLVLTKTAEYLNDDSFESWNIEEMDEWVKILSGNPDLSVNDIEHNGDIAIVQDIMVKCLANWVDIKRKEVGNDYTFTAVCNQIMLHMIDKRWVEHIQNMDYLRAGISLRANGQRDPLTEYKNDAYAMFEDMTFDIYEDFLVGLFNMRVE